MVVSTVSLQTVWVDFNYNGPIVPGTQGQPFNTIADAVKAVQSGGTVMCETGTTNETPTVNKNVTIKASGGTATVGQQ